MNLNFEIYDGTYVPYENIKQDYVNGIRGKKLREKYNLSIGKYRRLLDDFEADGVQVIHYWSKKKKNRIPKNYHRNTTKGIHYWTVRKVINGVSYYGGHFKTEAEAIARVKELNDVGWESCL